MKSPLIRDTGSSMKHLILLALIFSVKVQASSMICSNNLFVSKPVQLHLDSEELLNLFNASMNCFFEEVDEKSRNSFKDWKFYEPVEMFDPNCSMATKLAKNKERRVLQVVLSPKVVRGEEGFIKVVVDNSSAEYGTSTIKTLLKCFKN